MHKINSPVFILFHTLQKKCLPKPFAIKLFRTLSQNTRGCTLSFPSPFDFKLPALSGVEGSTGNRLSVNLFLDALDAASSLSLLFATLTKNTGGWGSPLSNEEFLSVLGCFSDHNSRNSNRNSRPITSDGRKRGGSLGQVWSPRVTPDTGA